MIKFYHPPKIAFDELIVDFAEVMDSGMLTNGEHCRLLEDKVRAIHGVDHVFTCSSATAGMKMLLSAFKTQVVALPSFTWKSIGMITENYVKFWLDIDKETWLPTAKTLEYYNVSQIDTFILQHTFGNMCVEHLFPLEAIPKKSHLIYDAAYSMGKEFYLPSGAAAVISGSPTKTITGCEMGLIVLNDDKTAEKIYEIRNACSRLSEINAVVALHYLAKLKDILRRKKQIFDYYRKKLPFPYQKIPIDTTYGYYAMLVENREDYKDQQGYHLGEVECRVRYEPLTQAALPNTDYVATRILCLPCYHALDEKLVVEEILNVLS